MFLSTSNPPQAGKFASSASDIGTRLPVLGSTLVICARAGSSSPLVASRS
jgi:hypothetical protein